LLPAVSAAAAPSNKGYAPQVATEAVEVVWRWKKKKETRDKLMLVTYGLLCMSLVTYGLLCK
jgi:hypothetical protein